jgi:hypothetical protein
MTLKNAAPAPKNGRPGHLSPVTVLYRFAFKMETEAAARSPTRKRVPGRTCEYVEESDADTH